ncbi:hypothetical protein N9W34_05595 [Rickettsiales bacterium]|nr:hypothetical protein [Rickettsiales bacterium]
MSQTISKTAMQKIEVFAKGEAENHMPVYVEIRQDLYDADLDKDGNHILFTKEALKLAVYAQRVNEVEFTQESKKLVEERANYHLGFSDDPDYVAIRNGKWKVGANEKEIEKLSKQGTTTLVHPGQNKDHCINADNMRLDPQGRAFDISKEQTRESKIHLTDITDREDAGSLDIFKSYETIRNAKEIREGRAEFEKEKNGKVKKYIQERQEKLPEEQARKTTQRINGLQAPEFSIDEICINMAGKRLPVRRMEWEIGMEYAAGTRDFLIPKLHNAKELKYVHDLMEKVRDKATEYEFDTSVDTRIDFLVEVADMPYQLEEAIFFLGGGNVEDMKAANERGEEYILPDGELAHKIVFGGWDFRANRIIKSDGRLGVPDISYAEDYMAYIADKRGTTTCGSMYVGLMYPNAKEGSPEEQANIKCIEGLKKQKTRDRIFHDTWIAQANPTLIDASNEIMSQEIDNTPVIKLKKLQENLGQKAFEKEMEKTLDVFIDKTYTKEEFDDLVELLYRYTLIYVAGDAHGCIPNKYLSFEDGDSRDMHDPATATERTRAILNTLVSKNAKLEDGSVCDSEMLKESLKKAREVNEERAKELNDTDLQDQSYNVCERLCTTEEYIEYGLYEIFEIQRAAKLQREPATQKEEKARQIAA